MAAGLQAARQEMTVRLAVKITDAMGRPADNTFGHRRRRVESARRLRPWQKRSGW